MSRQLNIPEERSEQVVSQTRHLISTDTIERVTKARGQEYSFYGVLLPSPHDSQVNTYIRTHWEALHAMSGKNCLLLTTLVPEHPTEEMLTILTHLVGAKKSRAFWQRYLSTREQVENDVYTLAQEIQVAYNKLPCLVLMASLHSHEQLLQRLPEWDMVNLERFFMALFTNVNHHAQDDPAKRLRLLKKNLGHAFRAKLRLTRTVQALSETTANLPWTEIVNSTLTNQELIASIFKILAALGGVPTAGIAGW